MLSMPSEKVTPASPLQPLNADSPILFTPLGIFIFLSAVQPLNKELPIFVIFPDRLMLSNSVQFSNA